jgi:hypothetical protein
VYWRLSSRETHASSPLTIVLASEPRFLTSSFRNVSRRISFRLASMDGNWNSEPSELMARELVLLFMIYGSALNRCREQMSNGRVRWRCSGLGQGKPTREEGRGEQDLVDN